MRFVIHAKQRNSFLKVTEGSGEYKTYKTNCLEIRKEESLKTLHMMETEELPVLRSGYSSSNFDTRWSGGDQSVFVGGECCSKELCCVDLK